MVGRTWRSAPPGLLNGIELRKLDAYQMPGTTSESVILQFCGSRVVSSLPCTGFRRIVSLRAVPAKVLPPVASHQNSISTDSQSVEILNS